jgi:nicotinamide mononucleotide transporter
METFFAPLLSGGLLEFSGLVAGLVCVWLLIRQNVWTWPVGILYVLISLWFFLQARLYADLALHIVFLVLNCYGWWFWTRGGRPDLDAPDLLGPTADRTTEDGEIPVTRTRPRVLAGLVAVAMVAAMASGWAFARWTDADLPYWDNTTTMLSLAAMWLSSRKKIENWHLWFVIDVLATGIYFHKELYFYALLYGIYTGMAVAGYLAWRRTFDPRLPATA